MSRKGFKILVGTLVGLMGLACQSDLYRFNSKFSLPEKSSDAPLVQFIVEENLYENQVLADNLGKVLDYAKIPAEATTTSLFNLRPVFKPSTRVLSLHETIGLTDAAIDSISKFVALGGSLHLTSPVSDPRMFFLMGIRPEAKLAIHKKAIGFYLDRPIFPGKQDFSFLNITPHLGLSGSNFYDGVSVHVSATNDRSYPVLVENRIGRGRVILLNSYVTFNKSMRGFLFSSLLPGLEGVPYPVANVATLFLDDFPSPVYDILKEPIASEMGLSMRDYVKDVWWPDMKKLAKRQNIKYTAYVAFDYTTNTSPPFGFSEWDRNRNVTSSGNESVSTWMGRNVIDSGHELGLHGYNHVSLLHSEWKNADYMVTALKTAEKKWKISGFGALPKSYVPPSNDMDSIGLRKLADGMPSLQFMQSLYLGPFEDGQDREFDPDPWDTRFFDYPRISSGYFFEPESEWAIESLYLYTGIWSHFVHPDDVFQIPDASNSESSGSFSFRNKHRLNWNSTKSKKGMLETFEDYVEDYKKRHPYTRFLNATESSIETVNWRFSQYHHSYFNGVYEVESFNIKEKSNPHFWLMYVDTKNEASVDRVLTDDTSKFQKVPLLQGALYSISTSKPSITVLDIRAQHENPDLEDSALLRSMAEQKRNYEYLRVSLMSFEDKLENYVADDNLPMATQLIEAYLEENIDAHSSVLKKYALYMVWQNRLEALWNTLNDYYLRHPNSTMAALSKEIQVLADYPSEEIRKLWLERQLDWDTNDIEALKEYYDYFNLPQNSDRICEVLKKLAQLNPTHENLSTYINFLIDLNAPNVLVQLDSIAPCSLDDETLSTSIAWAYADRLVFGKALKWQKCSSGIDEETVAHWIYNSFDFENYKSSDYPFYIGLLLANDIQKSASELRGEKPCQENLLQYADNIVQMFSDYGDFRNALAWSACAANVSAVDKMTWYFELGRMESLKEFYKDYIVQHPDDYKSMNHMANLLLYNSELKSAANKVFGIPLKNIDPMFLSAFNNEVKEMDLKEQLEMSRMYIELLNPLVIATIEKKKRQQMGNSLGAEYFSISDRLKPTLTNTGLFYEFYNPKGNSHRLMVTQGTMSPIQIDSFIAENTRRELLGIEYKHSINLKEEKKIYFRGRIEKDNKNDFYIQAGLGYSKAKDEKFKALQLEVFPVRSGPGHVLNLYRVFLNGYQEFPLGGKFKHILALESNYYTDQEYDAILLARLEYKLLKLEKFQLEPLVEASVGSGTVDRRFAYPYWMAQNRIYAGGGFQVTMGNENTKFHLTSDLGIFAENDQTNFERYTGTLAYRLTDYMTLNATFEFYTIENFYSNVLGFGLQYKIK